MDGRIICESSELAVECANAAQQIGLAVEPLISRDPFREAAQSVKKGEPVAIVLVQSPTIEQLVQVRVSAQPRGRQISEICLAVLESSPEARRLLEAAGDLGITALREIRPLMAALALLRAGAPSPWSCSIRQLPPADRARLRPVTVSGTRVQGQLTREQNALVAWSPGAKSSDRVLLGESRDAAEAIAALRAVDRAAAEVTSAVEGVDQQAVIDTIFGPARALSDPASKSVLLAYGMAMPEEELCNSASRAAAEANRMGYPVRIALASPDLRVWDHPDLAVDGVDNAARVREIYGLLLASAESRSPEARILGVTVAAANQAVALLGVRARPLPQGRVAVEIAFADPHGTATDDATLAVLPVPLPSLQRALSRLRGSSLIFTGSKQQRRADLESIADTLMRVAALVNDHRQQIDRVELLPLALLLGGGVEVREACVTVNDAFERSLQQGSRKAGGSGG